MSPNLHIVEENLQTIDLFSFSLVWIKIKFCVIDLFINLVFPPAEAIRTTVVPISGVIRTTVVPISGVIGPTVVRIANATGIGYRHDGSIRFSYKLTNALNY